MSKFAQTGRDLIDWVKMVLKDHEPDDIHDPYNDGREYAKAVIERDIIPLYEAYKSGDESRRHNLEELKWYYEAISTMGDEDWKYIYEQALHPYLDPGSTIEEEPEEVTFDEIWDNVRQMEPPPEEMEVEPKPEKLEKKTRRPVEQIMVKPPQGKIKEPVGIGSYVYNQNRGVEGQITDILSENQVLVINSKTGNEETWSTKSLYKSMKTHGE